MPNDYLGALPPHLALRRLREKHCLHKEPKGDGSFVIECSCGWRMEGLQALPDMVEHAAYMHRTEPDLLIPGSSDIGWDMRQAQLRELIRKGLVAP